MRFTDFLDEGNVKSMATEFVHFQQYIEKEVMDKTNNPKKAKEILDKSFRKLQDDIKKALKV